MGAFLFPAFLIACGLACVGCEVWGTYEYLHGKHQGWNYLVAGGVVLTSLAAVLPLAAEHAHRQRARGLKWLAWLAVPITLLFVFTVSIQRTGSSTDADESSRAQLAQNIKIANQEIDEATEQLRIDKAAVKANCKVWGPICTDAKKAQAKTETKLEAARKVLKTAGVATDDSMAKRIVAVFPFLSKDQVQLWQPMLLPIGLGLVGFIVMAIGVRCWPGGAPKPGLWARLRARRAQTKQAIAVITPEQIAVIPPTPKPRLVASNQLPPVGSVKVIVSRNLKETAGAAVELADLMARYRAVCLAEGKRLTSEPRFVADLKAMAKELDIEIRIVGNHLWLLGVRLSEGEPKAASN